MYFALRDFKEPAQTVPFSPSVKAPSLISALVAKGLLQQPVVRIEKLDHCRTILLYVYTTFMFLTPLLIQLNIGLQ